MNPIGLIRCVALSLAVLLAAGPAAAADSAKAARPSPAAEDDQILVLFHDERDQRIPVGDPNNPYRRRGDYGNSTWSERVATDLADDYGLERVAQWPVTALGVHCVVYRVQAARSVNSVLDALQHDKRVEDAERMQSFRVMSATSSDKDPYLNLQAGLRDMNVEPIHRIATGRDVRIAIVDTGIDEHHPDLAGQVIRSENFVPDSSNSADDIHGTAVAGVIAAAAGNGQGIVGVAPGAKLIGLKACWQSGRGTADAVCNSFTLALALNTAITLKPDILNLSLVGPHDALLKRLLERALANGMIVVASAPSDGSSKDAFPASVNGVIAVRSAASGADAGKALAAPGNEILTTMPHGTYNFMSGSSFAAAHVSGLIALLLELDPKLTAARISALLKAPGNAAAVAGIDACGIVTTMRPGAGCAQIAERSGAHAAHARAPL